METLSWAWLAGAAVTLALTTKWHRLHEIPYSVWTTAAMLLVSFTICLTLWPIILWRKLTRTMPPAPTAEQWEAWLNGK